MGKSKQRVSDSIFVAMDHERLQEKHDSRLIKEMKSQVANLPDKAISKIWNANKYTVRLDPFDDLLKI